MKTWDLFVHFEDKGVHRILNEQTHALTIDAKRVIQLHFSTPHTDHSTDDAIDHTGIDDQKLRANIAQTCL